MDLKKQLIEDENNLEKPLTYHSRTEHRLPAENSKTQAQLKAIVKYAEENEMKLNKKKTKVMLFNNAWTPELVIEEETIEVVEQLKLLGVQVTSDFKWSTNTAYITKRGYNKLWVIRRLKSSGANTKELCDISCKHVRSILEYAAVVWHSALTVQNSLDIERV